MANEPSWRDSGDGFVFVSHWDLRAGDVARLSHVKRLVLWNVKFPSEFAFGELPGLEFLDIRGGTRADLDYLRGAVQLRGLVVNQVRGLRDLAAVSTLVNLQILSLYGLAKVEALPDLATLTRLRRLELGQLRSLADWSQLASAPAIEELVLTNRLTPDVPAVEATLARGVLKRYLWFAPDMPRAIQDEMAAIVSLPPARSMRPEDWYAQYGA